MASLADLATTMALPELLESVAADHRRGIIRAGSFGKETIKRSLDLRFVLLHLFLADAKGCQLSVSGLARAMGLSRGGVRNKLAKLVEVGWCTNGGEGYALTHDIVKRHPLPELLTRKAEIITAAAKGVADLAASKVADSAMANLAS